MFVLGKAILNECMANANVLSCGKHISVLRRKMWTQYLVDKCFLYKQKDPSPISWIYIFIHWKNKQQKSHRDGLFLASTGKAETEELLGLLNNHFNWTSQSRFSERLAQRERGGEERKRERRVIEFLRLPIIVSGFYRHMHTNAYSSADMYTLNNVSVHTCTQVINISTLLTEKEIENSVCFQLTSGLSLHRSCCFIAVINLVLIPHLFEWISPC